MKHLLLVALAVAGAETLSAHHSYGAFDMTTRVEIEGLVEAFEMKSPHSVLRVRGDDKQLYVGEWLAAQALTRAGVSPGTLVVGQRVIVGGFLKRDFHESSVMTVRSVLRPSDGWSHPRRNGWVAPPN
jgi:hypothetical protein